MGMKLTKAVLRLLHPAIPAMVMPILPTCSHYTGRVRCEAEATVWIYQDDGRANPGGYQCEPHGVAVVTEYREKLGETWTLVRIEREAPRGGRDA